MIKFIENYQNVYAHIQMWLGGLFRH